MSLNVSSTLGHYDVTAKIGEGGMGEVYQARDTKLKRMIVPRRLVGRVRPSLRPKLID